MNKIIRHEMTWVYVLILSVASAVVTALLNCIPGLERTSLTAPAETPEVWVVLAVYIILNCKGYKDAMLKTFVFFLISQPLIYLIEVPFKPLGWGLFNYYPFWGFVTVLTIPGAALCYRVRKGDMLAALILSAANFLMIFTGLYRINTLTSEFPRFLLALIFCIAVPFLFSWFLLKTKNARITAMALCVLFIIAGIWYFVFYQKNVTTDYTAAENEITAACRLLF